MLALSALTVAGSLLIALLVGVYARPLGEALLLLDFPDTDGGRKRHNQITPLVGGLAVSLAIVGAAALAAVVVPEAAPALHLRWLAFSVAVMFGIGIADDRFHLSPLLRLGTAVTVLLLVISAAPDFGLAFLRFSGMDQVWLFGHVGDAFTLLCLVGLLNAVNMADGKNGIVAGMGLIWTIVLALHAPSALLPVLAAAAAALAVIWGFNMAGKLFLGDAGSYAISAFFGLTAIYVYNHDFEIMRADDVAVLFAIPVFDTVRLMAVRMAQRRSPFEGDRNHLHHHLYNSVGWPRGLWIYLALVAIPNAGAVLLPGTGLIWLVVAFIAYCAVMWTTRVGEVAPRPAE